MISRFVALLIAVWLTAAPQLACAQSSLRIAAAPSTHTALERLVDIFRFENPNVEVSVIPSTSGGVAALSADAADIAIVDRPAWELEKRPFRQTYGHDPLGFVVAQPTDNSRIPAIYVNRENPIGSLTLDQVKRIFATGLGTADIKTWGQAGADGNFSRRVIRSYGLLDDGGFATNFRLSQLQGAQFVASYEPFSQSDAVLLALSGDIAGIALLDTSTMRLPNNVRKIVLAEEAALAPPILLYVRESNELLLPAPVEAFLRLARSERGLSTLVSVGRAIRSKGPPPPNNYHTADGAIRIIGTNTMEVILSAISTRFAKIHPDVRFAFDLHKGLMAGGALAYGTSAFVPMPRELTARETDMYRELNGAEPLAIRIAHGSIIKQDRTATLTIYVNVANSIAALTAEQVGRIFTTGHPDGDITTWGQLGMTGKWARLPIHPVGMPEDSGFGSFMAGEFSNNRRLAPNQISRLTSVEALEVVGGDQAAIAYSATNFATPLVRAIPIAPFDDAKPLAGTAEDVMSGAYPLDRYIYLYVRALPDRSIEPWLKDYLRFVLSPEGQAIIAAEPDGFLPLNSVEIAEELKKLEGI